MVDVPPLLRPFFEREAGCVLYKAYPPQRGDDVPALLNLRARLPTGVRFVPMPPDISYLQDLRRVLPGILQDLKEDGKLKLPSEVPSAAAAAPARHDSQQLADQLPGNWRSDSEGDFLDLVAQILRWMGGKHDRAAAQEVMGGLKARESGLLSTMLRIVALGTRDRPKNEDMRESTTAQRDYVRSRVHIPIDQPILIIGRPELFLGYHSWATPTDAKQEPTDLRRIVESAGYPNRFHFFADRPNAPGTQAGIRDRKTRRIYLQASGQWDQHDIGFIFAGRCARDQAVIVTTGLSSLGTYAAVSLLLENRYGFGEAIDAVLSGKSGTCVDIGIRCDLQQLEQHRRFSLSTESDVLRITILNPDDFVGYTWAREARSHVARLLDAFDEEPQAAPRSREDFLGEEKYMTWKWDAVTPQPPRDGSERLLNVAIRGKSYQVFGKRAIFASAPLGMKLEDISKDLKTDKDDWTNNLDKWRRAREGKSTLESIANDPNYKTWRPILLLGRTGVGKEWVAEFIAREWEGALLENLPRCPGPSKSCKCLAKFHEHLNKELDVWPREGVPDKARMWPFAVLGQPPDLLGAELFGVVKGAYTGADVCRPGALIKAGTGVVFLDEFLELDLKLQASLLVALNDGRVQPSGATGESCYYVSRVVAATNRAASLDDLDRLAEAKQIREDLKARFPRRYVVPTLPERPLDIVPILIDNIRRERLADANYLRISRPAFEALITFAYPENIRDLVNLAFELPNEVVASFQQKFDAGRPFWHARTIKDSAILLKHLGRLGVLPPAVEAEDTWEGAHRVTCDAENEFYQFLITEDNQGSRPAQERGGRRAAQAFARPLELPELFQHFCEGFRQMQADLTEMRELAATEWSKSGVTVEKKKKGGQSVVLANLVANDWLGKFITNEGVLPALTSFYHHLARVHLQVHLQAYTKGASKGLSGSLLQTWLAQDEWKDLADQMPLHTHPAPYRANDCFVRLTWRHKGQGQPSRPELLPAIWTQIRRGEEIAALEGRWRKQGTTRGGQVPRPGGDTVLRVLYGRWIPKDSG